MELWFTEKQTPAIGFNCRTRSVLHQEKTDFQDIAVIDTEQFGRMLLLDGMVQTTIEDEFIYHEMISMIPLNTHPAPKKVLIIGGGDGGTAKTVLKHPKVEEVTLVEIDGRVMEVCRQFLPEIAGSFDDPRLKVFIRDGISYVQERENSFDIVLIDSTEPVGAAVGLFIREFYHSVYKVLTEDGILVAQTESPFYNKELIKGVFRNIANIFPVTKLFLANIPTYPSGLWSFTLGSKRYDPEKVDETSIFASNMKYYTPQLHRAAFYLPRFLMDLLE